MSDTLSLPNSIILKLVKQALESSGNGQAQVTSKSCSILNQATGVFILYLTSIALDESIRSKKKTISADDVLKAVNDIDIEVIRDMVSSKWDLLSQIKDLKPKSTPKLKATSADSTSVKKFRQDAPHEKENEVSLNQTEVVEENK